MAIRSFLLSFALTCFFGYALTFGLTDKNSFLKHLPDWTAIPISVAGLLAYLLSVWWACRGFRQHKLVALASLAMCAFGLSVYALGIIMQLGHGKAAWGQYDYDFATLVPDEKTALSQCVESAGLTLQNAVFTEHWHVADPCANGFRVCVQKGHVTALHIAGHPLTDLPSLSRLPLLSDLYLQGCGLSDMSGLRSTSLDRLDISDNQVTDLKTLGGCPNLRWLFAERNQLHSTDGFDQFRQIINSDFTGNPLP